MTVLGSTEHGGDLTRLLREWSAGRSDVEEVLVGLVYEQLHAMAVKAMLREKKGHLLQPTALVSEVWMRLRTMELSYVDRVHFLAMAATTMRRILVDHARAANRQKRNGGAQGEVVSSVTTLVLNAYGKEEQATTADILDLNRALEKLSDLSPRQSHLMVLTYFGGMTTAEAATELSVSTATVTRDLRIAKAWLRRELAPVATTVSCS